MATPAALSFSLSILPHVISRLPSSAAHLLFDRSEGSSVRIIFTGAKPRVAQHVDNRPRLLSVGETQSIWGLRSCDQYYRWSSQARQNPPAKSKNKNSVSGKTWFTVLCAVLISAAMDAREASAPGSELKWSGQRIQLPTGWNSQPALFVSRSETGYEKTEPRVARRC